MPKTPRKCANIPKNPKTAAFLHIQIINRTINDLEIRRFGVFADVCAFWAFLGIRKPVFQKCAEMWQKCGKLSAQSGKRIRKKGKIAEKNSGEYAFGNSAENAMEKYSAENTKEKMPLLYVKNVTTYKTSTCGPSRVLILIL